MTPSDISVVPMNASHTAQIADLEKLCFSDPWPEQAVAGELDNPLSYWLVALEGERVIGYVGSQTVLGEADIMNVAVSPAYRRRGIAAALLERLKSDLAAEGVYSLTLEVRASNEAAIALYGLLGYVQVGRRPGYYHNPKEDALILRKEWTL